MLQAEGDRLFADRFVTVRHGRYVLPVRAEARQRVRGIVHDRSQSGQTIFVEPEAAVEANNELVQALREEEQEAARILAELSDAVRARRSEIETLVEAIGELDWVIDAGPRGRAHGGHRAGDRSRRHASPCAPPAIRCCSRRPGAIPPAASCRSTSSSRPSARC